MMTRDESHEQIMRVLGRLEGKLEAVHESVNRHEKGINGLNGRVRDLEQHRARVVVIAAGVGGAVSIVASALLAKVI